ncbi:AAEL011533-PA [Aedes aegypti]|uniref:AAEL011533-PA n=1 Tax=Aedes aegypti TaxID=7159 RepID=Q16PT2_AEDAE|nr:AAEL011533-PA [Aedes aegypti]
MSVIIRLQNLPWSANALDVRNFFKGLSIPDGGVHIVGGEMGDAFIAFSWKILIVIVYAQPNLSVALSDMDAALHVLHLVVTIDSDRVSSTGFWMRIAS